MIYQLTVPGPIEDVEETRVLEWHRQEGESIVAHELLIELETSKAVVEIRSQQAVFLRRILVGEGQWQKIGQPLALLTDQSDEPLPAVIDGSYPPLNFDFVVV